MLRVKSAVSPPRSAGSSPRDPLAPPSPRDLPKESMAKGIAGCVNSVVPRIPATHGVVIWCVATPLNPETERMIEKACEEATEKNPVHFDIQGGMAENFQDMEAASHVMMGPFNDVASRNQQFWYYLATKHGKNPHVTFMFFTTPLAKGKKYHGGFQKELFKVLAEPVTWQKMTLRVGMHLLAWTFKKASPDDLVAKYIEATEKGWHWPASDIPFMFDQLISIRRFTSRMDSTTKAIKSKMGLKDGWPTLSPCKDDEDSSVYTLVHTDPCQAGEEVGKEVGRFLQGVLPEKVNTTINDQSIGAVIVVEDMNDFDNTLNVGMTAEYAKCAGLPTCVYLVGVPISPSDFVVRNEIVSSFSVFAEFEEMKKARSGVPGKHVGIKWRTTKSMPAGQSRWCTDEEMEVLYPSSICHIASSKMAADGCSYFSMMLFERGIVNVQVVNCGYLVDHSLSPGDHTSLSTLLEAVKNFETKAAKQTSEDKQSAEDKQPTEDVQMVDDESE